MSENEKTCIKCGKLVSQCMCKDRKIKIVHEFRKGAGFEVKDENIEQLKAERDSLRSVVALSAHKAFEDEKEAIVSQFPEDRRDEIDALIGENPDQLEAVRTSLAVQGNRQPEPIRNRPSGKVPLLLKDDDVIQSSGQKNEYQQFIDDLYQKAKLSKDPSVQADAERKIDSLFEAYGEGFSSREKNYSASGRRKTTLVQCLRCGAILLNEDSKAYLAGKGCNYCGWDGKGFVKHPQGQAVYY